MSSVASPMILRADMIRDAIASHGSADGISVLSRPRGARYLQGFLGDPKPPLELHPRRNCSRSFERAGICRNTRDMVIFIPLLPYTRRSLLTRSLQSDTFDSPVSEADLPQQRPSVDINAAASATQDDTMVRLSVRCNALRH
jgi:hypothetical protein